MTEKQKLLIEEQIRRGRVAIQTLDGLLLSADIEKFCRQSTGCLLYGGFEP